MIVQSGSVCLLVFFTCWVADRTKYFGDGLKTVDYVSGNWLRILDWEYTIMKKNHLKNSQNLIELWINGLQWKRLSQWYSSERIMLTLEYTSKFHANWINAAIIQHRLDQPINEFHFFIHFTISYASKTGQILISCNPLKHLSFSFDSLSFGQK